MNRRNEYFIQATIVLAIVTVIALFTAKYTYLFLLMTGMLLVIYSMRNLYDRTPVLILIAQLLISITFGILGNCFIAFLMLYEWRTNRIKCNIWLPAIIYMGIAFIVRVKMKGESTALILLHSAILIGCSVLLMGIERLITHFVRTQNQITDAVSQSAISEMYEKKLNRELATKNYLSEQNARLEERETISRNIHNSVGHSVTAAIMTLDAADLLMDSSPDRARDKINQANERMRGSLNSIRQAVRVLDRENEQVSFEDFICELQVIADEFVIDTMMRVSVNPLGVGENIRIPHEHTEFLTGAIQELLSNGARHGGANTFAITVNADSAHIQVIVADNGHSDFGEENYKERIAAGFGLKKMQSYCMRVGGTASFANPNGFRTEIELPLWKEKEDAADIASR